MLEDVRATLERFRVSMDRFFSERSLHEAGEIDAVIGLLEDREHVYPLDEAVWMRTTSFGDDKDRVLMRSTGEFTYYASDIAYHRDKLRRGYDRAIAIWGADHHGHVKRMQAAWEAIGGDPERLELVIMQLVNSPSGKRVQMSKREGEFVTLDDLLDDIGVDAARWFLLQRSHDTTLDLDLELARRHTQENPVYYVQYAHARIASILRRAGSERVETALDADLVELRGAASVGAQPDQAPARVPRRGERRGRAPRSAPPDRLRARDRAGVLGLLSRLQGDRRGRGGRRRGPSDRDLRAGKARDRTLARPARGRGAGGDVAGRPARCPRRS